MHNVPIGCPEGITSHADEGQEGSQQETSREELKKSIPICLP
jgi:hypothetical protein